MRSRPRASAAQRRARPRGRSRGRSSRCTAPTERSRSIATSASPDTGLATLTLDGAGGVNALRASFVTALGAAVQALAGLTGLVGVLVEAAHRPWCAGADLDELWRATDPAGLRDKVAALQRVFRALETCGAPVVAVLDGAALGGGFELALACHRRVAVDRRDVRVGLPEVTLGVIPGGGGTQRLPRLVGLQAALEVILAGRVVSAPEALGARSA